MAVVGVQPWGDWRRKPSPATAPSIIATTIRPVRDAAGAAGVTGEQVPTLPGTVQDESGWLQTVLQHTPPVQNPELHDGPLVHESPSANSVLVGVTVGVAVSVAVGVSVGVPVTVGVSVGVCVGVLVAVRVGVCVGVSVGVAVGVSVGVCVAVCVGVLVGVRVGV